MQQIGIRDYSQRQVDAWSAAPRPAAAYFQQAHGRIFLVAVDRDDSPIGYADLEPNGHIDHLFCRPDHVGTGVGTALCVAIEAAAREAGIATLFVEASEAARRVFVRRGFATEHRRDFDINGVAIHNYRMTKRLDLGNR